MYKVNAASFAKLLKAMVDGDNSISELASITGLHYVTVCDYTQALSKEGVIHICRWEPDRLGRHAIKIFKLGPGKDAKRPKLTKAERQRRCRQKLKAAQLLQVTAGKGTFVKVANGRMRFVTFEPELEAA